MQILTLNNGIEKVKQQQQQLDHELEFVLIQQRELEECIAPLEKELKDIPIADHDRNHTYVYIIIYIIRLAKYPVYRVKVS